MIHKGTFGQEGGQVGVSWGCKCDASDGALVRRFEMPSSGPWCRCLWGRSGCFDRRPVQLTCARGFNMEVGEGGRKILDSWHDFLEVFVFLVGRGVSYVNL